MFFVVKLIKTFLRKFTQLHNKSTYKGIFMIHKYKTKTGEIMEKAIINNTITNIALNEIIKPIINTTPDMEIKELAVGTGTTAPATTDTTIETEVYRVSKTDQSITDTGQVTTEFVLNGTEYAGAINEIGIFSGSGALSWGGGSGKDTGLMITHVLWSTTLAADESIYFQRIDTIAN